MEILLIIQEDKSTSIVFESRLHDISDILFIFNMYLIQNNNYKHTVWLGNPVAYLPLMRGQKLTFKK